MRLTRENMLKTLNTLHVSTYLCIVLLGITMLILIATRGRAETAPGSAGFTTIPYLQPMGLTWYSSPKQVETVMGKAGYQYTSNTAPKRIPQYLILKFSKNQEVWIFQFNQNRKLISYTQVRIQSVRELAAYAWEIAVTMISHATGIAPTNVLHEGVVGMAAWNIEPNKLIMVFANATDDTTSATTAISVSRLDI